MTMPAQPGKPQADVNHFEPQAVDPLHQPGEGCLIRQPGAKGGRAPAYGDFAVVEFCAQRGARLAHKGDLMRV